MTVRRVLDTKQKYIWTIDPNAPVQEGIWSMIEHNISALIVIENEYVVGIVTERDYVRKVATDSTAADKKIRDIMTQHVLYVRPDQSIDESMALMVERQVRHLPVIEDNRLVGILSMRDAVRYVLSDKDFMIEQLENYIMDRPSFLRN
jgi:CBS domain-containing protein